jgi:hypothetical protein
MGFAMLNQSYSHRSSLSTNGSAARGRRCNAGLFLTAVASGAVKWTHALAIAPDVLYLLAHPERLPQEISVDTVNQLGEALKAVAERGNQ